MGFTLFPKATGLTGLIVAAMVILPTPWTPALAATPSEKANYPAQNPTPEPVRLAQAGVGYAPVGCRITRDQIGVYQEPNLAEAALGILARDVTVTLGTGSGNGWARIVAPETGWIQAKFLRGGGTTPCPQGQQPAASAPLAPSSNVSQTAAAPGNIGVSRAVCAVLPPEGLIVRDQPNRSDSRVIGSIRPGNYTFQFTERRMETGESPRQWAYITAPAKGWISTGILGGGANLSGEGCS